MSDYNLKVGYYKTGLEYQVYRVTAQIPGECNSIFFRNQGTTVCTIDNAVVLQPSQAYDISGNAGEILIRTFQATFSGAGTNELVVISKVYL